MNGLPEKIGKYRVLGLAGKGSMGTVYIAHDPVVDRKVAVKLAKLDGGENEAALRTARQLFLNEAQAAGALDHPHILTIHDAGEADGQFYIVMEYLETADTLRSLTAAGRIPPVETALRIIAQCAKALDYAHAHGVIHRDIKPANIMLTDMGEVKICDFGIALRPRAELTQVMESRASPLYMAPEQAQDGPVTPQTDLFSLGVVMYELLTGRVPFAADNLAAVVSNLLFKNPEPVSVLRPGLPRRLDAVMSRALAKEPGARFASGAELASECDKLIEELSQPERHLSEQQKLARLRSLECFKDFSESEVREILKAGIWEHHRRGESILEEGTPADCFHILVSGEVSVRKGEKELMALAEGECFGEAGYLTGERRFASYLALRPVTAVRLTGPLKRWASLPLQMRMTGLFQQTLIRRLAEVSKRLVGLLP